MVAADKTTQLNASALPVVLSAAGTPIFMTGNTARAGSRGGADAA